MVSAAAGSFLQHFYDSVGIDPRQFQYQQNAGANCHGRDSVCGRRSNFGFFFGADAQHRDGTWLVDPWTKKAGGGRANSRGCEARIAGNAEIRRIIGRCRVVTGMLLRVSLTGSRSKRT